MSKRDLIERLLSLELEDRDLSDEIDIVDWLTREAGRLHSVQNGEGDWSASQLTRAADIIARLSEALAEAEKKGAEAAATIESLRNPWSSDMSAMPRRQDVLVYQPPHKAGRTTLPARICEVRNAGCTRESTHWMLPVPPRDLSQGGQHG